MSGDIRARLGLGPRPSYDTNPATNPLLPRGYSPSVAAPPTVAPSYAAPGSTLSSTVPSYDQVRHRLGLSQPGPTFPSGPDPLAAERALLASPPPVINSSVLTSIPPPRMPSPLPVTVPPYATPASPYLAQPVADPPSLPNELYQGDMPRSPPKVLFESATTGPVLSPSPGRSVPPPPNLHPPHPSAEIERIDASEAHCEQRDSQIAAEMAARELAAKEEEARLREIRAKVDLHPWSTPAPSFPSPNPWAVPQEKAEELRQLEARAQAEEKASAAQFANLQAHILPDQSHSPHRREIRLALMSPLIFRANSQRCGMAS